MNIFTKALLLLLPAGSVSLGGYFLYHNLDITDFPIYGFYENASLRNSGEGFKEGTLGHKYPSLLLSTRANNNSSQWEEKKKKYENKSKWNEQGFFKYIKTRDPYFVSKIKKGCAEAYNTVVPKEDNKDTWDLMMADDKWREVLMVCRKTKWRYEHNS